MSQIPDLEQLLRELRQNGGGTRHTILRVLGGPLRRDGALFHKETLQFEDEHDGLRQVDVVETPTCSFGHTLDDKVRLAGVCEIGGETLCDTPGCMHACVCCGATVCRRHSRTYGELTYCTRCRWRHYWRIFWGLE